MKRVRDYIIVGLGAALLLGGCTKEEIRNAATNFLPIFNAKIDGQTWTGAGSWTEAKEQLVISATSTNTSTLAFTLNAKGTGEYPLTGADLGGNYASYVHKDTVLFARSGKVIITKFDSANGRISGTFEFEAKNSAGTITKSVSEGKFNDIPKL